jgi:hypothetical protein
LSGEDFVGLAFLIPAPLGALWASMSYVALSEGGSWPATDSDLGSGVGEFGLQFEGGGCVYASTNGQLAAGYYYGGVLGLGTSGGHAGLDIGPLLSNGGDVYDQEGPFGGASTQVSDGPYGFFGGAQQGPNHCQTGLVTNLVGGWSPGVGATESSGGSVTRTVIIWRSKEKAKC